MRCRVDGRLVEGHTVKYQVSHVGRGGALVKLVPFNCRVVVSNHALAAAQGPWQVLHLQLPVALRRLTPTQCELLWSGALLKGSCCEKFYRNGSIQYIQLLLYL